MLEWPDHGPIRFEPVSAVAQTLKDIFERERPSPYFTLPYEIRQEIYAYLRYRNGADYARFRTVV